RRLGRAGRGAVALAPAEHRRGVRAAPGVPLPPVAATGARRAVALVHRQPARARAPGGGELTYWIDVLNQALIFGVFALSLNLLMGFAGQVSIAHAAFGAIVFGLLVSLPALRLAGEYLILLTLAVQIITLVVITSISALGGLQGLAALPGISLFGKVLLTPQDFLKLLVPILLAVFFL